MTTFKQWINEDCGCGKKANENETAPKGWADLSTDDSDLNAELKKEKIKVLDLDIKTDKDGEFDGYNLDVEYKGKKITLTNKDLGDHPRVKEIIKKVKGGDVNEGFGRGRRTGTVKGDPRIIKLKYSTTDSETGKTLKAGEFVLYYPNTKSFYGEGTKQWKEYKSWAFDVDVLGHDY